MFNFFKAEALVTCTPKIKDIVRHRNIEGIFLVTNVSDDSVELMGRDGDLSNCDYCDITPESGWSFMRLSETQQDRCHGRTPEQILRRKIDQRLEHLVTEDELAAYCRVDAIRNLIKGDLTK